MNMRRLSGIAAVITVLVFTSCSSKNRCGEKTDMTCVDGVVIFDEDNPLRVIQDLLPDILVKGGDWSEEDIIGADVVKKAGGEVKRIPYISEFSTTEIIKKIKDI